MLNSCWLKAMIFPKVGANEAPIRMEHTHGTAMWRVQAVVITIKADSDITRQMHMRKTGVNILVVMILIALEPARLAQYAVHKNAAVSNDVPMYLTEKATIQEP